MTKEALIADMQALKALYPTLTVSEVLKVFEIMAMKDLTITINRGILKNG